jgi:serine/threonine protein kinase
MKGAIFYEMLVGERLFKVVEWKELTNALMQKNHVNFPPSIEAKLSPECLQLAHRLLDKDEKKRISWEEFFTHPFLEGVSKAIN